MFDVSSSIRDTNPLQNADPKKNDQHESTSAPLSSILTNPKQKLTAQFKRAITMIKQRSEPTHESSSPKLLTSISLTEKPNYSLDQSLLTSLIEEPTHDDPSTELLTPKSQSFLHIKPPIQRTVSIHDTDSSSTTTATIINLDPATRLVNSNSQPMQPTVTDSTNQQSVTPQVSSSSATLSPTPSSTTTTGELSILMTYL